MNRLRQEGGFTMVESLVAVMLLVIGVVATLSLIDASRRTTFRAEQSQAINNVGQRELEKLRAIDYEKVAMTTMPETGGGQNHPGSRVGTAGGGTFDLDPSAEDDVANLVVNNGNLEEGGQVAGGVVVPTETFTTGDVSGEIHRYVVWRDDPKCQISASCAGAQDFKRVIVAVTIEDAPVAGAPQYEEFQTDVIDPDASVLTSDPAGGGVPTTAQQFWLSDQSCVPDSGEPTAANPGADSPTNDTTGSCGGINPPDALIGEAPPDPDPNDPANPAQFDYSNEGALEPAENPDQDKGLQMLRQDIDGCATVPIGTDAHRQIHWWDTRRLEPGAGGAFVMTGTSTLELWTRTINDVQVQGAICVYVRRRPIEAGGVSTPVPIPLLALASPTGGFSCSVVSTVNGSGKCSTFSWPFGSWQKLRINLQTSPALQLDAGNRLEIGISVERNGTPQNAIQFLYDHPTFDSRWEIITTTPL